MSIALSYDFETVRFWTERGIVFCQFLSTDLNYKLIEQDVAEYLKAIENLTNGNSMPLLVDLRNVIGNFSIEAVKLLVNNENFQKSIICQAFVTNSINGKLLVLSYKRIYEPDKPFKIFDNVKRALLYCLEEKKNFYASPKT